MTETEPIRHIVAAAAKQRKGRQLQRLAEDTLRAIDEGEAVAAQRVTDAELVDIAVLLLDAIESGNRAQIDAVGVGVTAAPGVPGRLLEAIGACALVFADAASVDWREALALQRARVIVDDALG